MSGIVEEKCAVSKVSDAATFEEVNNKYVELKIEKDILAAKCESLEIKTRSSDEKFKTLEVCLDDLLKRVNTTETENKLFEKKISDLETQLSELVSNDISATKSIDNFENKETIKVEFKEVTLERLTALENKIHDIANKIGDVNSFNEKKVSAPVQPNVKLELSENVITYCQYPPNVSGNITVTNDDYMCLGASQFLNDNIIDFFLKYLQFSNPDNVDDDLMSKTHIFTTFFYERLSTRSKGSKPHPIEDNTGLTDSQKMYERVRKWTKRVDLFKKDFIVVPINEKKSHHWYVCIICYPGEVEDKLMCKDTDTGDDQSQEVVQRKPCILVFDSLPDGSKSDICSTLRSYLTMEWKAKVLGNAKVFTEENMPQYNPIVRGQKNSKDCGIFLLQYVQSFFQTPMRDWTDATIEHRDWFDKEEAMKKRGKIAKLIRDLAVKQNYERKTYRKLVFPDLDFRSVESPVKNPKVAPELKPLESSNLDEQTGNEFKAPIQNTETKNQGSEAKSEDLEKSSKDSLTRDPRLAKGRVLFHKKGNKVSVSQCKDNIVKRSGDDLDLNVKKVKTEMS